MTVISRRIKSVRVVGKVDTGIHVEGGSTPAPSSAKEDVDPEIAAIDAAEGVRYDAFGAIRPFNPPG